MNKSEVVKEVYRSILNAIDGGEIEEDDIFTLKRGYFTGAYEQAVRDFAELWFVEERELYASAVQYNIGADPIPNIGGIINSKDFASYKEANPGAMPLKYGPSMKREWRTTLDQTVIPLSQELR
ncbi:Uncharacterised protein [Exiguobacterium aurantiacum]|uniref:Uncharacterized protein n=1 Tax=Exiguobacterium aurantiacum TaxID=33987 RepID=A0A377HH42_9BACL|nr:Uncharacterised protein [Exiguobacterium aurantiacum]